VDMRDEAAAGNRQPLSRRLLEVIDRTLTREEQVILYLNRRGMSTFVLCRDCGKSVQCLGCSVALVRMPKSTAWSAITAATRARCRRCAITVAAGTFAGWGWGRSVWRRW